MRFTENKQPNKKSLKKTTLKKELPLRWVLSAFPGFTILVLVYLAQNYFDVQYYLGPQPYQPLRIDQPPPHYGYYYLGKGLRVLLNDLGMILLIRGLIAERQAQHWAWWTMGISAGLLFPSFIFLHYHWGPEHPVLLGFLHRLTLHPLLMIALLIFLLGSKRR